MNSFYGQMRWGEKFEQFFYEFRITNHPFSLDNEFNKDPEKDKLLDTLLEDEEVFIQPNEDFAIFNINTANYWIGIIPIDSRGDDRPKNTQAGFSLFHQSPNIDDSSKISTLLPVKPEDLEISLDKVETLKSGDILKIINGKYDKAGHFTGEEDAEKAYFKLPEQIIRIDNTEDLLLKEKDQKFHFRKDPLDLITLKLSDAQDELTFQHATFFTDKTVPKELYSIHFICNMDNTYPEPPPEGRLLPTTVRNLEPGDYIGTQILQFDQGGHLIGYENISYRLPFSEVDERLTNVENAVIDLQNDLKGVHKDIDSLTKYINELNKAQLRVGDDSQFEALGRAVLIATSIDMGTSFSLAYSSTLLATRIKDLYLEHQGINASISLINTYLHEKFGFEIP